MSDKEHVVEGEAVEVGTEVVAAPGGELFGTREPAQVVVEAVKVADVLRGMLVDKGMTTNVKGKTHVNIEGWQTLGTMLGVSPVVVWTRPVEGGWEARAEARNSMGRVIGAAEAQCVEAEGGNWGARATSNARRAMAQTRAMSRALRGPLGFVVSLAGYQAAAAEEMPEEPAQLPTWAAPATQARQDEWVTVLEPLIGIDQAVTLQQQLATTWGAFPDGATAIAKAIAAAVTA